MKLYGYSNVNWWTKLLDKVFGHKWDYVPNGADGHDGGITGHRICTRCADIEDLQ